MYKRQVVECAFGIMSNKWRLLLKAVEVDTTTAETIVKCICLLHNVVIDKEGMQDIRNASAESCESTKNCFASIGRGGFIILLPVGSIDLPPPTNLCCCLLYTSRCV